MKKPDSAKKIICPPHGENILDASAWAAMNICIRTSDVWSQVSYGQLYHEVSTKDILGEKEHACDDLEGVVAPITPRFCANFETLSSMPISR